jgi:hypothetical protein
MGAFAKVPITRDGNPAVRRVHLLGTNDEIRDKDGRFYYHFPLELRKVLKESRQFARLQKTVMFAYTDPRQTIGLFVGPCPISAVGNVGIQKRSKSTIVGGLAEANYGQ